MSKQPELWLSQPELDVSKREQTCMPPERSMILTLSTVWVVLAHESATILSGANSRSRFWDPCLGYTRSSAQHFKPAEL